MTDLPTGPRTRGGGVMQVDLRGLTVQQVKLLQAAADGFRLQRAARRSPAVRERVKEHALTPAEQLAELNAKADLTDYEIAKIKRLTRKLKP